MQVADPEMRGARRWPIRWRLPLLICTLLLASVVAFGWVAHREVQRALLDVARTRLHSVSRQLASLLAQSMAQRVEEARRLAARPALKALIDAPADAAARAAAEAELSAFAKTSPAIAGIEVWSASGGRLLQLGPAQPVGPLRNGAPPPRTSAPTEAGFGPLQQFHDGVFYELATPITGSTPEATGWFVLRRVTTMAASSGASSSASSAAASQPQSGAQVNTITGMIGGLIGASMTFKFGSNDGVWTDLATIVPPPPAPKAEAPFAQAGDVREYASPEGDPLLGVSVPVGTTPWTMWVAIPRSAAIAPATLFLQRAVPLGLAVVAFGSIVAWVAARRLTRPLDELTAAADALASGDLTRRARIGPQDELGRFGLVFNAMANRVEKDHQLLEDRVRERTGELEQAVASLRSTQEELVRREKLAMLGQLASGVGHELRNPLGVMTNAVYFLDMVQPDAPEVVKEYHGLLRSQIGLSEKIVSDLLDFARIKPPRREVVPLTRLIDDQLARVSIGEDIRVVRELPPDLPAVNVDPVQIGQVVLNLFVNAVQAMEERGGVLTLRGSLDEGRVRLDVCDTGPGVKPELQDKIFEALFTTKARGIGLGLSVSRSLAEANNGQLLLSRSSDAGATFTLIVPAVAVPVMEPAR